MTMEPTYAELKKQNDRLQIDLNKTKNALEQATLENEKAKVRISYLQSTLDHLDTCIYIKDTERKYLYANKKTLKLFNCTAEELQGSSDLNYFPKDTCEQLSQIDRRILELGENTNFEVESKDNDGNRIVFLEIKLRFLIKTTTVKLLVFVAYPPTLLNAKKMKR